MMNLFERSSSPEGDIQEFWKALEESLGTPILGYSLGQYLSGGDGDDKPLWGLLYLTETRLYFRHFSQQNWVSAIMQNNSTRGPREVQLEVPLEEGIVLEEEPPAGILGKLLGSGIPVYQLADSRDTAPPFRFTVEQRESPLIPELKRVLQRHSR